MITEPRWRSFIVETTQPIFTPEQCKMIIAAGRNEPRNDASVGSNKGIKGGVIDIFLTGGSCCMFTSLSTCQS